jgi:hypothetical protein
MITFVATAFQEKHDAHVFIGSMLCQKNPNWKAIIYANGHNQYISSLIANINDDRLMYKFSQDNSGYWGCFNRIKALDIVDTKYVVQTSIQDYYTPNAIDEILKHDEDLIYWNCLHNHYNHELLDTQLKLDYIDWGSFAIKKSLDAKINNPTNFASDGLFIEELINEKGENLSTRKINKILTIHN